MSKKKTLNEVRRFMTLANIGSNLSSNFVGKLAEMDMPYRRDEEEMTEGEEEEILGADVDMMDAEDDMIDDIGDDALDDEADMEYDMESEEEAVISDEEAGILIALGQKLAAAQEMEVDVEDDMMDAEDDMLDAEDDMMDAEDDMMDAEEDLTLEGILDSLTQEAQGYNDKDDESISARTGKLADKDVTKKGDRDDSEGDWGKRERPTNRRNPAVKNARRESVAKENALVQEVLKRIRTRLRSLAKK
tara:strand:+ start:6058 stop:6798 length:741 start_codon:yes stop_codon:yes gene_type:complete